MLSTLFAGLVSALVYRDLGLKRLHAAVVEAGLATGVVLLVIMASAAIGWLLTFDQHARRHRRLGAGQRCSSRGP